MKLIQFQKSTLVIYEITDVSLKISSYKLFKKATLEIQFENILVNDVYELKHHNKSSLPYLYVFLFFTAEIGIFAVMNPKFGWTATVTLSVLSLLCILHFIIPRTKIHIPSKNQGMIDFFRSQPSRNKVREFIEALTKSANLAASKRPKESDIHKFGQDYFAKEK